MTTLHVQRVPSYEDVVSPSTSCSFFFDQPRLGPCDLQDPHWPKMSSGATGKKRKKPEAKPQSQINKCLNEKRRREQENIYIEELAELISNSFTEISSMSVKPDKCAILQETVNQIRNIKQLEVNSGSDAVQQGEISSTKPTIITNDLFGPLLLEALEGFLLVVSKEGNVEFITDNVTNFLNYEKEEVLGTSIYNLIHHGDHSRFSQVLLPVSSLGWPPVDPTNKSKTFTCRLLVKPPDDQETMEEKQQRVSKYENMQISSTMLPYKAGEGGSGEDCSSDLGPCLMCVVRRIPQNEKHLQLGAPIEQFTIKLELGGKIIALDASGLSATYSQYITKELLNWNLLELVHPADKPKAQHYLNDMLSGNSNSDIVSPIYRIKVSPAQDKYLHVQTKSKFFKCANSCEPDFVMATYSIIHDNDVAVAEASSSHSCSGSNSSSGGSVGGPLMASVNGSTRQHSDSSFPFSSTNESELNYDFLTEFPSSSLNELGLISTEERISWDRPESRHSTPAPSPHPSFAPAQPSPYQTFPFSPLGDQPPPLEDTKERKDQSGAESEGDSARLRRLLTNKRESIDSDEGSGSATKHHPVLKGLLNSEEDEDINKNRPPSSGPPTPKVSAGNNMLLKLLNDKPNDDVPKQNELLTQLLKEEEAKTPHHHLAQGTQDDPLLKSLGFSPSPEGGGRRKRPSEDGDEPPAKKTPLSTLDTLPPVSSSAPGNSKLWEKNKMLASLLAKQPATPTMTHIPPVPASVISATPQDKLPRIIKQQVSVKQLMFGDGLGWSGSILQHGVRTTQIQGDAGRRQQQRPWDPQQQWDNIGRADTSPGDQFLSDILDQFIDIVPDAIATDPASIMDLLDQMEPQGSPGQSHSMSEKMAINAIQKSLMQCETVVKSPTYTMGSAGQSFPGPPPMYTTRPRFNNMPQASQIGVRSQYTITNQQQLIQQQQQRIKIIQQKQRLLQQQQQQHLLIPINAAAAGSDSLHNIDSLINNTVAPNVSLQRSSSVPDSQLSPGGYAQTTGSNGAGAMLNSGSQISPSQRQPYSPLAHQQPFSPVNGGIGTFQQNQPQQVSGQARLSPLPNFQQAQLSPRVSQGVSPQQQGGVYTVMSQTSSWPQQQTRLTLQQQQNPMLNAQLTGGSYTTNSRNNFVNQQQQQQQRVSQPQQQQMPSVRRQSPYSPDTNNPQYRLQRTLSVPQPPPQATTQLPGGVRHYAAAAIKDHHPVLSPSYSHPHMYPPLPSETPQFCFDQSTLQLYGGTCDRGRLPGGGNNGMTEYVRQELRAMVGARQQQVRVLPGQASPADFEALGLSFEMPSQGGDSPKMAWGTLSSELSPPPGISRGMDEVSRPNDAVRSQSSLLQKLLSE